MDATERLYQQRNPSATSMTGTASGRRVASGPPVPSGPSRFDPYNQPASGLPPQPRTFSSRSPSQPLPQGQRQRPQPPQPLPRQPQAPYQAGPQFGQPYSPSVPGQAGASGQTDQFQAGQFQSGQFQPQSGQFQSGQSGQYGQVQSPQRRVPSALSIPKAPSPSAQPLSAKYEQRAYPARPFHGTSSQSSLSSSRNGSNHSIPSPRTASPITPTNLTPRARQTSASSPAVAATASAGYAPRAQTPHTPHTPQSTTAAPSRVPYPDSPNDNNSNGMVMPGAIPPQVREKIQTQVRQQRQMPAPPLSAATPTSEVPVSGHRRTGSNGTQESPEKVAGRRARGNSAPRELDVEHFEAARRRALLQPHDPSIQLEFAKALVEASTKLAGGYTDPNTPSTLQVDSAVEARNRDTWTQEANQIVRRLATKLQEPEAVYFLACNYSSGGLGLDVDAVKAFELYAKASKTGHPQACYRVAVCYELGVGTRQDSEKALSWYKKAAKLDDASSMYKLGMILLNGTLGQRRSFDEALAWLQMAADRADRTTPHAVYELGNLYEHGDQKATLVGGSTFVPSAAKALEMYAKAGRLGHAPAQYRLGRAYEFGQLGCEISPQKSIAWYTTGAQAGYAAAELGLCGWYWTGAEGVLRRNDAEAYLWAERAAHKGLAKAMFALGYFYEIGVGVPADVAKARSWYQKALDRDHPRAAGRLQELDRKK